MNVLSTFTRQGVQFGVSLLPWHADIAVAKAAEECGFDFALFVDSQLLWPEVYTVMTATVLGTQRIKVGTGVTNPVTRHPTVAASGFASLDALAGGGRTIFGLGRGDSAVRAMGMDASNTRLLRDYAEAVRGLLAGKTVNWGEGQGARLHWWQPQPIPLLIAPSGPRTLALAGEIADAVYMRSGCRPDLVRWALGHVAQGAARAGRAMADLDVGVHATFYITDNPSEARELCRGGVAAMLNLFARTKGVRHEELPEDIQKALALVRGRYQYHEHLAADALHALDLPEDVTATGAIAGSLDYCRQRIHELVSAGINHLSLSLLSVPDAADRVRQLRLFSEKILPDFR